MRATLIALALLGAGTIAAQDGAPLVLESQAAALGIWPADVADARLGLLRGQVVVRVTLADGARSALAELTTDAVGTEMVIRFCGLELLRPRLWSPLDEGRFTLGGAIGAEGQRIVEILLGREECRADLS